MPTVRGACRNKGEDSTSKSTIQQCHQRPRLLRKRGYSWLTPHGGTRTLPPRNSPPIGCAVAPRCERLALIIRAVCSDRIVILEFIWHSQSERGQAPFG